MKQTLFIAAAIAALAASALADGRNMPLIQTKYTADPAPLVVGDTVYLYTTHDEDDADGFKMLDWLLYTSTDMVNWQDHGAVASLKDFAWCERDNGAWAEQVVNRNGKYYMYCPIHGNGIGVLVSDTPYGPFKDPIGKPLVWQREHWDDIDPTVLIDDDGQAYMYWGNPTLYSVRLNEDMISTAGEIRKHPHIEDYQEGPWIWKRNGKYYLAFASTCCPEGIGYAMSDGPEGPWEYKGHIMDHTPKTRGNHPGIINFKGKDYVFGLNYDILRLTDPEHHERRSVSAAEMTYNDDGTIQEVPYFLEAQFGQNGTFNPLRKVEAETMAWGFGLKTKPLQATNQMVTDIDNGEYILIKGADFGKGRASKFSAMAKGLKGGDISVRLDSSEGPEIARVRVMPDSPWNIMVSKMKKTKGIHDLYIVFEGEGSGLMDFDWWQMQ